MITNWIKSKLGVTELEKENLQLKKDIDELRINKASTFDMDSVRMTVKEFKKELNKHTRVDVDMQTRGRSYICISGKWRGNDYVEVIPVESRDFEHLMRYIKDIRAWDKNNRLDEPFHFKGVFDGY